MQELIAEIAANQKISKAKTKRVIGSLITQINKSINDGEVFRVPGLGTLESLLEKSVFAEIHLMVNKWLFKKNLFQK